jgi:hypothetical protein
MPGALLLRYLPSIIQERWRGVGRVVSAARTEFGLARALGVLLGVWLEVALLVPHALIARRRIQRSRKISVADLDAILTKPERLL